jgi:hypothetical protein
MISHKGMEKEPYGMFTKTIMHSILIIHENVAKVAMMGSVLIIRTLTLYVPRVFLYHFLFGC